MGVEPTTERHTRSDWMVLKVGARTREVDSNGNVCFLQETRWTNAAQLQDLWGMDGARR